VSRVCEERCSLILRSSHPLPPLVLPVLRWRGNSVRGWNFFGVREREGEKLTNGEVRMSGGLRKEVRGHFHKRKVYSNGATEDRVYMY
jgi:hypothetical protein